jgi:hypothetical protein
MRGRVHGELRAIAAAFGKCPRAAAFRPAGVPNQLTSGRVSSSRHAVQVRKGLGPCGGIGRRARLKIEFRKECWFDSGQGHQNENVNKNNNLNHWFDSIFLEEFSRLVENTG